LYIKQNLLETLKKQHIIDLNKINKKSTIKLAKSTKKCQQKEKEIQHLNENNSNLESMINNLQVSHLTKLIEDILTFYKILGTRVTTIQKFGN